MRLPSEGGWSGVMGQRLLAAVSQHCVGWAVWVERRCCLPPDPHRRDDLASRAWEVMKTHRDKIIAARNPWGYVTRAVLNAGRNAALADALLTSSSTVQGGCVAGAFPAARLGADADLRDVDHVSVAVEVESEIGVAGGSWGAGLRRVHEELVAAGAPPETTSVAIDRVVDLAGWARRGWREAAVKEDPIMRTVLGLSPEQCTLLLALVAGPRRGGVEESLWWRARTRPRDASGRYAPVVTAQVRARVDRFASGFDRTGLPRAG